MATKKYQVFISSTFADLADERRKALDVLLMADCIPAGMEAFVATDLEQFEVIKRVIDLCDYYILIIGKRYGSVDNQVIKRVLNQLKALKLVYSKWNDNKSALFWGLTPKGEKTRNDMIVVKSKK